ncbi:MAG: S-methyl-5-thioribose kinase [Geminicoccaceae bacterium]|nr:S-methyl-5-thioribose kinase [Geminicoccaceae bacterium]MDW8369482.1 S-methyl-5-thioribose kinase [Geminicoccaceae bacterium]
MAIATPQGYRALGETTVAAFLARLPEIRDRLGGEPAAWRVREVGDGNLNLVFLVEGPEGSVCVKQALPYVRLVGESWPLGLERARFEWEALLVEHRLAPGRVPEPLHFDETLYAIVMERLAPHIIMRKGMIAATVYPNFAEQIAEFMANTLYFTSDLGMPAAQKKKLLERFAPNVELCKITEDLIFTDPYMEHERNRWTSPQLDDAARAIREDLPLKQAVALLKLKFLCEAQALVHGDLHTGSIMVTATDTRVIDPEFAFLGPIGFDVGKLMGNLLMSCASQPGHERRPGERADYQAWILRTLQELWNGFEQRFLELWRRHPEGDAFPRAHFLGPEGERALEAARRRYMRQLFEDSLGYAGTSMIRRTLGLAHNADMETIADPDRRAACERRNLALARELIVEASCFTDIAAVADRARIVLRG